MISEHEKTAPPESRDCMTIREWIQRSLADEAVDHSYGHFMDTVSGLIVEEALKKTNGNRSRAAKLLNLSRPTLHAKLLSKQSIISDR
jgi:two-component system nitrogen regulation response regulator GlnG